MKISPSQTASMAQSGSWPPRLLTIDDEQAVRNSFRYFLEDLGYCVSEASDALAGISAIDAQSPDLIIVDLRMPRGGGLEVLRHIKSQELNIPVIVVSGTGVVSDVVDALREGAWDYVLKPVEDLNILRHVVERTLERKQLKEQQQTYQQQLERELRSQAQKLEFQQLEIRRNASEERLLAFLGQIALKKQSLAAYVAEWLEVLLVSLPWLTNPPSGAVLIQRDCCDTTRQQFCLLAQRNMSELLPLLHQEVEQGGKCRRDCDYDCDSLWELPQADQQGVSVLSDGACVYQLPLLQDRNHFGALLVTVAASSAGDQKVAELLRRAAYLLGLGICRCLAEERLRLMACSDTLTGLKNREGIKAVLRELIDNTETGSYGAILSFELDGFVTIRDALGHAVGDAVLVDVARRLQVLEAQGYWLGCIAGDNFCLVIEPIYADEAALAECAVQIAQDLQRLIAEPLHYQQHEFRLSASVGVASFPQGEGGVDSLLAHADSALHRVKRSGAGQLGFYSSALHQQALRRLLIERELRRGIDENQFEIYFQPQVDINGQIGGAEVLLRWPHPEHGWLSPAEFIPVAEDSGLIVPLSQWLLRTVFCQYVQWQREQLSQLQWLSINISPRQFQQACFVDDVLRLVEETGCDPRHIVLELTEGVLIEQSQRPIEKIQRLKAHGFRFSIDDFGTGFSSLAYLRQLPLDELKIDRSFVRDVHCDGHNAMIVETILEMARFMNLHVVAEGVENHEEYRFLLEKNCTSFQGYFFGHPCSSEDFLALLRGARGSDAV